MSAININLYIPIEQEPVPLKSYNYLSSSPLFEELDKDYGSLPQNNFLTDPFYFLTDANFTWNGNGAILIPTGQIDIWYQFYHNGAVWQDVTANWNIVTDVSQITNGDNFILVGSREIDGVNYIVYSFYGSNGRGTPTSGPLELSFEIS